MVVVTVARARASARSTSVPSAVSQAANEFFPRGFHAPEPGGVSLQQRQGVAAFKTDIENTRLGFIPKLPDPSPQGLHEIQQPPDGLLWRRAV